MLDRRQNELVKGLDLLLLYGTPIVLQRAFSHCFLVSPFLSQHSFFLSDSYSDFRCLTGNPTKKVALKKKNKKINREREEEDGHVILFLTREREIENQKKKNVFLHRCGSISPVEKKKPPSPPTKEVAVLCPPPSSSTFTSLLIYIYIIIIF